MKDWIMKHPILTFLLIDEIIAAIQTIALKEEYLSTMDETREIAAGIIKTTGQVIKEKIEEKKR